MPYSERSSIRPEAANYAVRGATLALRTTPRVSRAKAVLQVVYSVWSIVCVHIAALPAIFVARAGTRAFDIVMAPIVICTRAFRFRNVWNHFVISFKRLRGIRVRKENLDLHGNIDVIFF